MATAFQSNAFQNNAFQIDSGAPAVERREVWWPIRIREDEKPPKPKRNRRKKKPPEPEQPPILHLDGQLLGEYSDFMRLGLPAMPEVELPMLDMERIAELRRLIQAQDEEWLMMS